MWLVRRSWYVAIAVAVAAVIVSTSAEGAVEVDDDVAVPVDPNKVEDPAGAAARVLSDQQMLIEMHRSIQDPKLVRWIKDRTDQLAHTIATNVEAQKEFEMKILKTVEEAGKEDIASVEHLVEREIEGLVSSRYQRVAAWTLSLTIVAAPLFVTAYGLSRMGRRLSVRQFLLLGHVTNTIIALVICVVGLLIGNDPLARLQAVSRTNFVVVHLLVTFAFGMFCMLLASAIRSAENTREKDIFVAQLCLYVALAVRYHYAIGRPAITGQTVSPSWVWYPLYLGVFLGMSFLTAVVSAFGNRSQGRGDIESSLDKHE